MSWTHSSFRDRRYRIRTRVGSLSVLNVSAIPLITCAAGNSTCNC